jgi:tRNA A-37 threonylcarbamoyl transferase component Bud32
VIQRTQDKFRWQMADDFAPLLESVLKAHPELIKESAAKLVARHEVNGRSYYVKRYRHDAFWLRPLKFLFKRSQAKQEWELAAECEKRGVPIVRHVALGERWGAGGLKESVLITEAFDGGVPLSEWHSAHYHRVMEFVERIARAGVVHHDFHPSNLLIHERTAELRLIDLHGAEIAGERAADESRDVMLVQLAAMLMLPVSETVLSKARAWRRRAYAERSKRCWKVNRDFGRREFGELRWQVRRGAVSPAVEVVLRDPDGFLARAKVLKAGRSATVGAADGLVLKRYNFKKPLNAVKDLFRGSKGRRGFQKAYHLELCGFPTPCVLATADRRVLGFPVGSYILMEEVPNAVDAGKWNGDVARGVARLIGRLHEEGFTHRDLKETNILFDGKGTSHLIDLDGLVFMGTVSIAEAVANLRRLSEGMQAVGRLTRLNTMRFMHCYCRIREVRPRQMFPRERRTQHAHRSR